MGLRGRCRSLEQMDSFPAVLKESIKGHEIEMIAFPKSLKRIKTCVFFICPTEGNKEKAYARFQQAFDCKNVQPPQSVIASASGVTKPGAVLASIKTMLS